jgi:hypothetical protein
MRIYIYPVINSFECITQREEIAEQLHQKSSRDNITQRIRFNILSIYLKTLCTCVNYFFFLPSYLKFQLLNYVQHDRE